MDFIPRLETRFLNWPHLLSCHVLSVFSSYFLPLFKTEIYLQHFTPYLFSSNLPHECLLLLLLGIMILFTLVVIVYLEIFGTHTHSYIYNHTQTCVLCVCENACMIYRVLLILDKQLKISPLKRTISPALNIPPLPGLLCLWVEPITVSCFHVTVSNDVLLLQVFPEKFPFWCY